MENTNKWERSPNSGVGRNSAISGGGVVVKRDGELGEEWREIDGSGEVVEVLTRMENGVREDEWGCILVKLKGCSECGWNWSDIDAKFMKLKSKIYSGWFCFCFESKLYS